jgi:16S rRNA (cytosine967-C5)-methyltransferase
MEGHYERVAEDRPRQIAYRTLRRTEGPGGFVEHQLDADSGFARLTPADRRLAQELVFGILRQRSSLDWLIARRTQGRTQKPALQDLLRLGLYQLFYLDRIPAHAAVHETVELAREAGFGPQSGFINAVLRGCDRERTQIQAQLATLRRSDPAIGWSQPAWLVERWQARFGPERLLTLLEWNNSAPPTFARVNTLRVQPAALQERWRSEGVEFTPRTWDWTGDWIFELQRHPPLAELPSFRDGGFYIQDPSTLLAVQALAPQPGEQVLDLCAAPGGKTSLMAQVMRNEGRIFAYDSQPARLRMVEENCQRLGVTCVSPISGAELKESTDRFDRILVDAPCSNTGVLRRRLELRWRLQPTELPRLQAAQLALLEQSAPRLKPGGTLVYSTCSLEPEENADVVSQFLASHPGFTAGPQREIGPLTEGVDGAFVATLVRTQVA